MSSLVRRTQRSCFGKGKKTVKVKLVSTGIILMIIEQDSFVN